jgi:hypothetical protein
MLSMKQLFNNIFYLFLLIFHSVQVFSQDDETIKSIEKLLKEKKCEEAEIILNKFDFENSNINNLPLTLKNLGNCFGKDAKGLKYLNHAYEINRKIEKEQPNILEARICQNLAEFYLTSGNLKLAEVHINNSLNNAANFKNIDYALLYRIYLSEWKISLKTKDFNFQNNILKEIEKIVLYNFDPKRLDLLNDYCINLIRVDNQTQVVNILTPIYNNSNTIIPNPYYSNILTHLLHCYANPKKDFYLNSRAILDKLIFSKIATSDNITKINNSLNGIIGLLDVNSVLKTDDKFKNICKKVVFEIYYILPKNLNEINDKRIFDSSLRNYDLIFKLSNGDSLSQIEKSIIGDINKVSDEKLFESSAAPILFSSISKRAFESNNYITEKMFITKSINNAIKNKSFDEIDFPIVLLNFYEFNKKIGNHTENISYFEMLKTKFKEYEFISIFIS